MNFLIRPMEIADYDAALALWRNTPGIGLNAVDDSRAGIEKYLQRNPGTSFVAVGDGVIAGTILAGHDGRRGFLCHACVAGEARRRGVGTRLAQHALAALRREGISKVALVVFGNNGDGNAFWEKMGMAVRTDLAYRDKALVDLSRIDP